ncbi:prolyl oligopeptidase-like protein [Calycina marina]|uniref:Prolyl oligopeptidase-like protein n=1 Tax=Calycina marina TaxID=1763456 RepID=A0A9P7ZCF5_9HELO|nr:prolyl oligopeptidase-like protein [Calycina marina]
MATQDSSAERYIPLPNPESSLWHRVTCCISIWIFKLFVTTAITASHFPLISGLPWLPYNPPTFTKVYEQGLTNRVFVPKSWKSGDPLLPLYIDIHGGGFCLCSPHIDDRTCTELSNNNNLLVVSLDYRKAPTNPYPAAVNDLIKAINSVLDDESMPFDRKKVAVGGFSAGANLSLAVCQDESLQGKIGGIISFYAPVDWSTTTPDKLLTRPSNAGKDALENSAPWFNWAYVNVGQNLKDSMLSPLYAPSNKLPPKIYFLGCEFDMLCKESELLAERLAKERSGEDIAPGDVWEKGGIKWEKILGEGHGFDASPALGEKKVRVEKRRKEMLESAAAWLFKEVYVSKI